MTLERVPWDVFSCAFAERWRQGEHVFVYGETGSGKTDLAFRLLNMRGYGVAFITKPRDDIFSSSLTRGYRRIHSWPPRVVDNRVNHFLLSAKPSKSFHDEIQAQRILFPDAFESIYKDGGWTVLFDETLHLATTLGMSKDLSNFAYLARSSKLTGVYCSQRPKNIPPVIIQSCKYAFIARCRRSADLDTLSELGYSKRDLSAMIRQLHNIHDFIFVDPQSDASPVVIDTHR